jgi:hypothetical protein
MKRCGCPEEDTQQKVDSPGRVERSESIAFAIPLNRDQGGVTMFENGKLKTKVLSVCRAAKCTFDEMYTAVVAVQIAKNSSLKFAGYYWALCEEIRGIVALPQQGTSGEGVAPITGAFCVIDDGEPSYHAHAVMGYSQPDPRFWAKHDRAAARANLLQVFEERGILYGDASPPFLSKSR